MTTNEAIAIVIPFLKVEHAKAQQWIDARRLVGNEAQAANDELSEAIERLELVQATEKQGVLI